MRIMIAGALLVMALAGCDEGSPQGTSDCSLAVRSAGAVYWEKGFVRATAQPAGRADLSSCDDMGEDATGAYFPEDPDRVDVWSFEGQETGSVLGVLESAGRYRVFVAEGVDAAEVLRDIRQSQSPETKPSRHEVASAASTVRRYLQAWVTQGPSRASRYLVPSQRSTSDVGSPRISSGTVTSYHLYRWEGPDEFTLLVSMDLRFINNPVAWNQGSNERFVTARRTADGSRYRLEFASSP